jgi:hypothetical protein
MSRFRYICGGALGRSDVGSVIDGLWRCFLTAIRSFASWGRSTSVAEYGGGFAWAAAATALTDVCGAGAPLTIWSSVCACTIAVYMCCRARDLLALVLLL